MLIKKSLVTISALLLVVFSLSSDANVYAAKKVPKKANVVVSSSVAPNKQSVSLYLANLQKTKSVQYQLSYLTNGKQEGAGGTITTKGKYSLSRKLLFGTCSNKVCRYHKKLKNAVLIVVITFQDGTSTTRTFKLRV